jgi:hypothetical protein
MKWKTFVRWFATGYYVTIRQADGTGKRVWREPQWKQGEHMAIVAPTGAGKTTFVSAILPARKYVMALDPKGGDTTLAKLIPEHGFERVDWPLKKHNFIQRLLYGPDKWERMENGEPVRIIVGRVVREMKDFAPLSKMLAKALYDSFSNRGWTVYIDELQMAADRRLMRLGKYIELNLIAARDRNVSMVMSYQRPANVPRSAGEMSTWFVVFYTRDKDTVRRVAEMAGRPREEIQGMLRGIPNYCILLFSRNPRQPVIITRAEAA